MNHQPLFFWLIGLTPIHSESIGLPYFLIHFPHTYKVKNLTKMSEKIGKMKPDKIRKRIVIPLDERKGYAEMIKYENANLKTLTALDFDRLSLKPKH